MNAKSIIGLVLLGLFIVACLQNIEAVAMHFLFWSFDISKLLLLIIIFVIGIFVGMIIPGLFSKAKSKETKENKA